MIAREVVERMTRVLEFSGLDERDAEYRVGVRAYTVLVLEWICCQCESGVGPIAVLRTFRGAPLHLDESLGADDISVVRRKDARP